MVDMSRKSNQTFSGNAGLLSDVHSMPAEKFTYPLLFSSLLLISTLHLLFSVSGCVQTVSIIGPIFGYLLGSLCAKIYVDIGFVDMGEQTDVDPHDSLY